MNDDNKPCPFCGSDDTHSLPDYYHAWSVECGNCDAQGPFDDDKNAAWRLWNTRAAQPNSDLDNAVAIQCTDGNWDYGPYMHGMANGLLLAQAFVNGTEYTPLESPDEWLSSATEATA